MSNRTKAAILVAVCVVALLSCVTVAGADEQKVTYRDGQGQPVLAVTITLPGEVTRAHALALHFQPGVAAGEKLAAASTRTELVPGPEIERLPEGQGKGADVDWSGATVRVSAPLAAGCYIGYAWSSGSVRRGEYMYWILEDGSTFVTALDITKGKAALHVTDELDNLICSDTSYAKQKMCHVYYSTCYAGTWVAYVEPTSKKANFLIHFWISTAY
ncbi:MAG: hypothetical protein KBD01_19280 [Acidobacteria bacterium]|nr:hypothetical protein [Acidobacteriota bacterium]